MKTRQILVMLIWLPIMLLAQDGRIYFVVDGSGSMSGVPLQESKNAMLKMGKIFFGDGKQISLVVGKDKCSGGTRIATDFMSSSAELEKALSRIKPTSNHNITLGFEYAQEQMKVKEDTGHIYMFGDCDGLEYCHSIKQIAAKYKKKNYLTPFTYLQVDGCTEQEKLSWNTTLKDIGADTGSAATFDYKKIIEPKINIHKKYFTNPKYINTDGTKNRGNSYRKNPWKCIESDGLMWLVITKEEQSKDFYIKKPKYVDKTSSIEVSKYISSLDDTVSCGETTWRLPDHFELSRLTQIGADFRARYFPYIKVWAHLSSTGGKINGFKKGVNLDDGSSSDYREDRPYAAIFVSGEIDKSLFEVPRALMVRGDMVGALIKNKNVPKPKKVIDNKPIKKCTQTMFAFEECTFEECLKYGDCRR